MCGIYVYGRYIYLCGRRLHYGVLIKDARALRLRPISTNYFGRVGEGAILLLPRFSVRPLYRYQRGDLMLTNILGRKERNILHFGVTILYNNIGNFKRSTLNGSLQVKTTHRLYRFQINRRAIVRNDGRRPINVNRLTLRLLISLRGSLIRQLLKIITRDALLNSQLMSTLNTFRLSNANGNLLRLMVLRLWFTLRIRQESLIQQRRFRRMDTRCILLIRLFVRRPYRLQGMTMPLSGTTRRTTRLMPLNLHFLIMTIYRQLRSTTRTTRNIFVLLNTTRVLLNGNFRIYVKVSNGTPRLLLNLMGRINISLLLRGDLLVGQLRNLPSILYLIRGVRRGNISFAKANTIRTKRNLRHLSTLRLFIRSRNIRRQFIGANLMFFYRSRRVRIIIRLLFNLTLYGITTINTSIRKLLHMLRTTIQCSAKGYHWSLRVIVTLLNGMTLSLVRMPRHHRSKKNSCRRLTPSTSLITNNLPRNLCGSLYLLTSIMKVRFLMLTSGLHHPTNKRIKIIQSNLNSLRTNKVNRMILRRVRGRPFLSDLPRAMGIRKIITTIQMLNTGRLRHNNF